MLILINMDIVVMVLDLMHVHNFHGQKVNRIKMFFFQGLKIVLLCMLIKRKKVSQFLVKVQYKDQMIRRKQPKLITLLILQDRRKYLLSLHYIGSNSFLFVDATKMYQFKAKDSEIKPYPQCLGNISKYFSIDDVRKRTLKGYVFVFSVVYKIIDANKY